MAINNNTVATATTTAAVLLPARAQRQVLVLCNNGASDVYLAVGDTAVAGSGITLKSGAPFVFQPVMFDRDSINEEISFVTATGSSSVSIWERYLSEV